MAKAKKSVVATIPPDDADLDDLLGDDSPVNLPAEDSKLPNIPGEISDKPAKVKTPRVIKGDVVTFKNKAGETITGPGVLYYVVRFNKKLHYKEASQVTVLPADQQVNEQPDVETSKN